MKKIKIVSLFILLAVLLSAGWLLINFSNQLSQEDFTVQKQDESEAEEPAAAAATPEIFNLEAIATSTAFQLLEQELNKLGIEIQSKYYEDMGIFIESIGDKINGDDNKYWLYYVNDEMPMLAADKLILKPGDILEFKFEESTF